MKDVEGGAADSATGNAFGESIFNDELAAGAVHDADAGLHDGDGLPVDEAFGLGGEADVEGEEVGLAEEVVDGDEGDVVLAGDHGRDKGVVADQGHAEGAGAAGDLETDAPETDDAEGLAAELGALERFLVPLAGVHGAVGGRNFTAHGDHEAEGELGDGDGVSAGGVHDDNAVAGSGVGVDVVHADAGAADDAELGRVLEQRGVDLNGGADDQGVGVPELVCQGALDFVGGDDLPAGFLLQNGEGGGRDFFGENNLHGWFNLTCSADRYCRVQRSHPLPNVRKRFE